MSAPRLSRSPKTAATYLLLLINCLAPMAAIVIAPSLPQMQAHFADVPNVQFLVPVALTIPGLLVALLSPVVGILADRFGRKRLLVSAVLAYGVLGTLPLLLESLYAIIASRVALGCAEAVVVTISTMLIGDYYSGAQRQKYLVLQTTFASSSAILFFMIGGALGEFGWRVPFIVYTVPLLMAAFSLLLLWEPTPAELARSQEHEEDGVRVFRPFLLLGICAITFLGAVAFMVLQIQLAYLLVDIGESSPRSAGMIASACSVMIVLGTLAVHLLKRLGLRVPHCLTLAFGLIATSFLLIPTVHSSEGMFAVALINGLGCGLMLPTLAIWNMGELPWYRRGLGTGMWYGSYCLGMFLSPILVVTTTQFSGSVAVTVGWLGWSLLPVVVVAFLAGLRRTRVSKPCSVRVAAHNLEDA